MAANEGSGTYDAIGNVPAAVERQIGSVIATALVVGNMIGAGIFMLPAALAPFGQTAIYGWLLTIAGVLCLASTLAILSSKIEGGPFAYVERAFGPACAFMVVWTYLISIWVGLPALTIAAVSYLSYVYPALGQPGIAPATGIGFVWALVAINSRGARSGGMVQLITSILKVLPLIAVALVAGASLDAGTAAAGNAQVQFSGSSLAGAAALTMFAMLGFESATLPADKVCDPRRTVPRATVVGAVLTGLIYLVAYLSIIYVLSGPKTAASAAPFADAVTPLLGSQAGIAVALFAAISALGCLNGWVLCSGEVGLTLARDGVFPAWLAKTTKIGTPVRAQVLGGIVATLLILFNYSKSLSGLFQFSALVTTVATLFLYAGLALAALVLASGSKRLMISLIAVPGLAFTLFAFWGSGLEASLWGTGLLATGILFYWFMRRSGRSIHAPEASPAALAE